MIKQQYLGGEKVKKKVLKATERMKFVFDWDADEDTSRDLNPLYQNLHGEGQGLQQGLGQGLRWHGRNLQLEGQSKSALLV
jgi:ATP-dependent RNA helicase DDX23/PRP28